MNEWQWDEETIQLWQLKQFNQQLARILPLNAFYVQKLGTSSLVLNRLEELSELPLTTKQELVESADSSPESLSAHHTFPRRHYSRIHRTSGTTGHPLIIMDTTEDWQWWSATWQHVLEAAELTRDDRVFMAFSFGPFIGFWSAHQACVDRGATVIPGGGLSSLARLEFMRSSEATAICCTPSYALHLAEVARVENFPVSELSIRRLIVAGEAGGSVPNVRSRIEKLWQAEVVDHCGATEIGAWGFGWPAGPGLHIIETQFIAEFLPLADGGSAGLSELVLTSLGRYGAPVMRYRTGDIVKHQRPTAGRCRFCWLPEGVIGRVDNMVTIRGVNIFPSSIAELVREVPSIDEYRVTVTRHGPLDQLELAVEAEEPARQTIEKLLTARLGLRIPVHIVPPGTLPRSDGKSQRWHDQR